MQSEKKSEIEQDRGAMVQGPISQDIAVTNVPSVDTTVSAIQGARPMKHKLLDIFSEDVRARTALAVFLMAMQQLSGIDGVLYVSDYTLLQNMASRNLIWQSMHPCFSNRLALDPQTPVFSRPGFQLWLSLR
jgi:hypothetical protein